MRHCPMCDGELEHIGGQEWSASERGGNPRQLDDFRCKSCGILYKHNFEERFSGDIETWWMGVGEDEWKVLAKANWPVSRYGKPAKSCKPAAVVPATSTDPYDRIYIWNSNLFADILEYQRSTGVSRDLYRRELPPGAKTWRGDHNHIEGELFGYYASSYGPVFFHGKNRYPLRRGFSRIEVHRGEKYTFELWQGDERVIQFSYEPLPFGWDAWSAEEDVDLFIGLKEQLNKERFFEYFGVDGAEAESEPLNCSERDPGEYIFVFDRETGQFRERYRLVEAYDALQQFDDINEWTGFVPKLSAGVLTDSLGLAYPDDNFEVVKLQGKTWSEVEVEFRRSRSG